MHASAPNNQEEILGRECALIDAYIDQVIRDDGVAYAYKFANEEKRRANHCLLANLNVYAMVGATLQGARHMERVDYFLPAVTASAQEKKEAAALGLVCVGFIRNHYRDVLGVCEGGIDETLEAFAETMATACYSRLPSLTPEEAVFNAVRWATGDLRAPMQEKQKVIDALKKYKNGLISVYYTHISTERQRHPESN